MSGWRAIDLPHPSRRLSCLAWAILVVACPLSLLAEEAAVHPPAKPLGPLIRDQAAIPSDTTLAIFVRPAELAQAKIAQPIVAAFEQILESADLGLKVSELEQVKIVVVGGFNEPSNDTISLYILLRSRQPHDWKKVCSKLLDANEQAEMDGHTYFKAPNDDDGFSNYWCPDARTVILGTPSGIALTFTTPDPNDRPAWADRWKLAVESPLAVLMGMQFFKVFDSITITGDFEQRLEDEYAALTEDGEYAVAQGDVTEHGFAVAADAVCRSAEGAKRVAAALQKLLDQLVSRVAPPRALDEPADDHGLSEQMPKLVEATTIAHQGSLVHVESMLSGELLAVIGESIEAAVATGAQQLATQKKMEQLAAALNKYHEAHGHYPAPSIMGSDGRTPHSWRVSILPYLEGGAELSGRYRTDEPWDSEHNWQIMLDGASLFAVPSETAADDPPTCGYFLIVGKGTLFDGDSEATRASVTDPAAATILLVEARRPTPWSKPEDIEYDPNSPLPTLGGNFPSQFAAAFVDGTVRMLPVEGDEAELRAMFSKAAGDGTVQPAAAEVVPDAE